MSAIKILMADDEPAVLEIMAFKVNAAGYDVITASDGKTAWERIQSENPDLVILDLIMPYMDGFAVLSQLRNHPPSKKWIPVIIISTSDEIQHIQKSFDLQADHYLIKPCRMEDVLKAIKLMVSLIPLRNP